MSNTRFPRGSPWGFPRPDVMAYGGPPIVERRDVDPIDPRFPPPGTYPIPHVPSQPAPVTINLLEPCPTCNRHIVQGSECPFCFAKAEAEKARAPQSAKEKFLFDAWLALIPLVEKLGKALKRYVPRRFENGPVMKHFAALEDHIEKVAREIPK